MSGARAWRHSRIKILKANAVGGEQTTPVENGLNCFFKIIANFSESSLKQRHSVTFSAGLRNVATPLRYACARFEAGQSPVRVATKKTGPISA